MISHGVASPPYAALWGPQGYGIPLVWAEQQTPHCQPQLFVPYKHQGRAVALAPAGLLSCHHLEGQYTQHSVSSTANPLGAPLGNGRSPGSDVHKDDGTSPGSDIPLISDVPMVGGHPPR